MTPDLPLDIDAAAETRRRRRRPRAGWPRRLRYTAAQGLRVGWYAAHYAVMRRLGGPLAPPGEPPYEPRHDAPDGAKTRKALMRLFEGDLANIEAGLYPAPRDFDPRRLIGALEKSRRFFEEFREVDARRLRRGGVEVRERAQGAERSRYPAYYLQNFHYQSDGWLSRRSAELYDMQVEVLFTGAADAMRRAALAEVARELQGRDQRAARLIDVACGSGRFLEQTLDAFPRLNATALDLSGPYLEEARERLAAWPQTDFVEANAEAMPIADGAFDLAVSIYLFHELPPRVRPVVARELARAVKPGGLVVFADSIQLGDDPNLDRMLEVFPRYFHEPYYSSYAQTDLDAMFAEAGLVRERETVAFLTKVRTYRKPA